MGRWEHRGEERKRFLLKEEPVSRKVLVRRRTHDVVIHGPKWKAQGRPKKPGTRGVSFGPKNGDAAVVIAHEDIRDLCNKLQKILSQDGGR